MNKNRDVKCILKLLYMNGVYMFLTRKCGHYGMSDGKHAGNMGIFSIQEQHPPVRLTGHRWRDSRRQNGSIFGNIQLDGLVELRTKHFVRNM
ncbi:uncharacterized protein LOC143196663 isoform X3 [Rhynchophorus ferrugineus]|uniref:uncharacterized protein LOC143196663 isoform X3 n=1 Tax=Rhynchophorus ferrugineus TaxID=354439 RepID=UPI003FCD99C6